MEFHSIFSAQENTYFEFGKAYQNTILQLLMECCISFLLQAFGGEPLPYVGGAAPRKVITGNVFTANEAPPDQLIPFHHEMAQVLYHMTLFAEKKLLNM